MWLHRCALQVFKLRIGKLVNGVLDGYRQNGMSYEEIILRRRQKDEGQDG